MKLSWINATEEALDRQDEEAEHRAAERAEDDRPFFADTENPVFDGPRSAPPLPGLNTENAGE